MARPRTATHLSLLFLLLLFLDTALADDQDSLAYIFRQDNLSTGNDLHLAYTRDFQRTRWQITDLLRYKVFTFENNLARGEQYSIEHQLRSDLSWGAARSKSLRFETNQYQDHRTGLASNIMNQALLGGYKLGDQFSFFLGGRSIERFGLKDEGWATELEMEKSWHSKQQGAGVRFSGFRDDLSQHLSYATSGQANYAIGFGQVARFETALSSDDRDQSFFTDSLGSSQNRLNNLQHWRTHFIYRLSDHISLFHELNWDKQLTEITQEKVTASETLVATGENRERFALVNESGVELQRDRFSAVTALKVENSQNKYYVDYTQELYQFREEMTWLGPALLDSLVWKTVFSRLKYDTPDTTNNDDRDELRLVTELSLVWRPSPFYKLVLGTKTSLFHLIYLFNSRSSENHWNRNLQLWSGFSWMRAAWSGESRGRVRSNYFDYDYDDLFLELEQPSRSFVHRSLDLQQSLQYKFSQRWAVTLKLAAKWEDEGQLDWNAFIQQIHSQREQTEAMLKLFYDYRGWTGWIGYLEHDRITRFADQNRDAQKWHGTGPLFGLQHSLGHRLYLDADARFVQVRDQDRDYLLPKVFITLVYR